MALNKFEPDVLVRSLSDNVFVVEVNNQKLPEFLRSNKYTMNVERGAKPIITSRIVADLGLDTGNLSISLQHSRAFTLLKCASHVVERQFDYFTEGFEALVPMTLSDVAEGASVHESTVSRIFRKYSITCPEGVKLLKYFLSNVIKGEGDKVHSSKVIMERISKLVTTESSLKPLSDNKICAILKAEGCTIARRTVAKYRENMGIPPASKRKPNS